MISLGIDITTPDQLRDRYRRVMEAGGFSFRSAVVIVREHPIRPGRGAPPPPTSEDLLYVVFKYGINCPCGDFGQVLIQIAVVRRDAGAFAGYYANSSRHWARLFDSGTVSPTHLIEHDGFSRLKAMPYVRAYNAAIKALL